MPARIVRELTDQEIAWKRRHANIEELRTALLHRAGPMRAAASSRADRSRAPSLAEILPLRETRAAECLMVRCRRMVGTIARRSLLPASMLRLRHWRLLIQPATVRRPSREAEAACSRSSGSIPSGKTFPGVRALDSVQFDVAPGESACAAGRERAGKSTLIKIMSGTSLTAGRSSSTSRSNSAGRRTPSVPASPRSTRVAALPGSRGRASSRARAWRLGGIDWSLMRAEGQGDPGLARHP